MMWLMETALTNAAVAAVLAVVVWGISGFVRRPAVTHALWVLVLVKLITPPLIHVPLPWEVAVADVPPAVPVEMALPRATSAAASVTDVARAEGPGRPGVITAPPFESATPSLSPVGPVPAVRQNNRHAPLGTFGPVVLWVWVSGSLLLAGWILLRLCLFSRLVRRGARRDPEIQRQARRLAYELGLRISPRVLLIDGNVSPMLLGGFGRVTVLFPRGLWETLDLPGRRTLLMHELIHYRRGDNRVRLLELVCLCLYWWHPVVWWVRRRVEQAEEECCDAFVVSREDARTYAEAIVSTLDFLAEPDAAMPPLASGISDVPTLRRRLTQIMHRSHRAEMSWKGRSAIAAFCLCTIPLHPFLPTVPAATVGQSTDVATAEISVGEPAAEGNDGLSASADRSGSGRLAATKRPLPPEPLGWWNRKPSSRWASVLAPDGGSRLMVDAGHQVRLESLSGERNVDLGEARITCAAYLPGGRRFVTGSTDGSVRLWDVDAGEPVSLLGRHGGKVTSIDVDVTGESAASGGRDGSVIIWEVDSGSILGTWTAPPGADTRGGNVDSSASAGGDVGPVSSVRFSPDGRQLLLATGDWRAGRQGRVVVIDAERFEEVVALPAPSTTAVADFIHSGRVRLLTWDGRTLEWDLLPRTLRTTGSVDRGTVAAAVFSPHGG